MYVIHYQGARRAALLLGFCLAAPAALPAQGFDFTTPTDDRWQYPFNFSAGTRPVATCFSSLGTGVAAFANFNNRDGVIVVAWNTAAQIPPGLGAAAYDVDAVRVTLTNEPGATWAVDLTPDEWFTFDANNDGTANGDGIPRGAPGDADGESDDADAGRPLELFGAGFGPVYTLQSWVQASAYVGGTDQANAPRDPFPFVFQDGTSDVLHVEDSVFGRHNDGLSVPVFNFTPVPWAVGVPENYTPGAQSTPFRVHFDLDLSLSSGRVREWFAASLNAGRVVLVVTSLAETEQFGDPAAIPSFYMKEGVVLDPLAAAPKLSITLGGGIDGDLNGDGCVDLQDLTVQLANYGTPSGAAYEDGDVDGDGDVDLADLTVVLANYGAGECP